MFSRGTTRRNFGCLVGVWADIIRLTEMKLYASIYFSVGFTRPLLLSVMRVARIERASRLRTSDTVDPVIFVGGGPREGRQQGLGDTAWQFIRGQRTVADQDGGAALTIK